MQTTKTKERKRREKKKKKDIAIPSSYVTNNGQPALSVNDVKQQALTNRTSAGGWGESELNWTQQYGDEVD